MSDIVQQLRDRACPAGLPHTGENPEDDHGHTDCWLHHQAANEIERLQALITEWADAEDVMNTVRYAAACQELRKVVGR